MPGFEDKNGNALALRRAARGSQGLLGSGRADEQGRTTVLISMLAPHPENARSRMGDLTGLVASIKANGLLQELVVTPRDSHLEAWPAHGSLIGDASYVIICGHQRLAAAVQAGLTELAVRVRPELSANGRDLEVMLSENGQRNDLSPIDEARTFARLQKDFKRKQEDICAVVGCSQSHVSKRLALLRLPVNLQDAIEAGDLAVRDAVLLESKLKTDADRQAVWQVVMASRSSEGTEVTVLQAISQRRREQSVTRRSAEAQERAAQEGLEMISGGRGQHTASLLLDDESVALARSAGTLAATVDPTTGTFAYVSVGNPQPPAQAAPESSPSPSPRPSPSPATSSSEARPAPPQRHAETHATDAAQTRDEYCKRRAIAKPTAADLPQRIAGCLVTLGGSSAALALAHTWLRSGGVGPDEPNPRRFAAALADAGGSGLMQLAHAVCVAADELATRTAGDRWPAIAVDHLGRLVAEQDYTPTPWELDRMQAATATQAA